MGTILNLPSSSYRLGTIVIAKLTEGKFHGAVHLLDGAHYEFHEDQHRQLVESDEGGDVVFDILSRIDSWGNPCWDVPLSGVNVPVICQIELDSNGEKQLVAWAYGDDWGQKMCQVMDPDNKMADHPETFFVTCISCGGTEYTMIGMQELRAIKRFASGKLDALPITSSECSFCQEVARWTSVEMQFMREEHPPRYQLVEDRLVAQFSNL